MEKFFRQNCNIEDVEVIIFDFDETLYSCNGLRSCYFAHIRRALKNILGLDERQAAALMEKYGFVTDNPNAPSFNSTVEKMGISKETWRQYREDNVMQLDYDTLKCVDNGILKQLSHKRRLYIVSNEIMKHLVYKAEHMGLDLAPFTQVLCAFAEGSRFQGDKKDAYQEILAKEGIPAEKVLVIGDRIKVDLQPIIDMGGNGLLITNVTEIESFAKDCLLK
ncbi:MAG: HAD hydrolase-like protein [Corallococcus sp.]|nr:HAD hydrolase-like protein [Corallococcus sp.]